MLAREEEENETLKDSQSLSNLWDNIKQANMYLTGERNWGPKLEATETEKIAQIWKKRARHKCKKPSERVNSYVGW